MMDDSLPDTTLGQLRPITERLDQELIAELKRRGYKVYPEKRVRIYGVETMVSYREEAMRVAHPKIMEHINERQGRDVGMAIFNAGAVVRSRENNNFGTIHRSQVAVILPNDWDFESEMWGIR